MHCNEKDSNYTAFLYTHCQLYLTFATDNYLSGRVNHRDHFNDDSMHCNNLCFIENDVIVQTKPRNITSTIIYN